MSSLPPLYSNQRLGVKKIHTHPRYGLFFHPGTGKTRTVLEALDTAPFRCSPTLVVCPLSIVDAAWLADAQRFTPGLRIISGAGTKKRRLCALRAAYNGDVDVVVMNFEAARVQLKEILMVQWKCLVIDESTKIKTHSAKISKSLHKLADVTQRVYLLSGSPVSNSMMDFWSQIRALDYKVLDTSFWSFRNRYFYQPKADVRWLWVPKPDSSAEIMDRVKKLCVFVKKEDCMDLPSQTYVKREITLSPPEMRLYKEFIRDLVIKIREGHLIGRNPIAELMKCRALTAGLAHITTGEWVETGDSKLKAVMDLSDEIGRPTVVLGQFRRELERLYDAFKEAKRRPVLFYGGLSADERRLAVEGFQGGTYDVFIGHPASMAHGLTLTRASDMIWASLDHSYEKYFQACQRIHRIGQTWPCTYYLLVGKHTVEEKIVDSLMKKETLSNDVIDYLAKEA